MTKEEGKEYDKKYRLDNPEKVKEYARTRYLNNPEKKKESAKKYCLNNPEKVKERVNKYRLNNPKKIKELGIKHRLIKQGFPLEMITDDLIQLKMLINKIKKHGKATSTKHSTTTV